MSQEAASIWKPVWRLRLSFPLVPYVGWPIIDSHAASRRVQNSFGTKCCVLEPTRGTEDSMLAIQFLKPDAVLAVSTCTLFSLGLPLPSSPLPAPTLLSVGPSSLSLLLPTLPQPCMTGSSPHVSTIVPTLIFPALDTSAPNCVFRPSSTVGLFSVFVPIFVHLGASVWSGGGDATIERSSNSLVPAYSTLSRPCAEVLSAGSLAGSVSDANALGMTTISRQLTYARRQRDAARHKPASVLSELHRVKD